MAALTLHPDRLFPSDPTVRAIAQRLYREIAGLPIVSPHGHTDPKWFAESILVNDINQQKIKHFSCLNYQRQLTRLESPGDEMSASIFNVTFKTIKHNKTEYTRPDTPIKAKNKSL